jgi:hypothetical protein
MEGSFLQGEIRRVEPIFVFWSAGVKKLRTVEEPTHIVSPLELCLLPPVFLDYYLNDSGGYDVGRLP